MSTATAAPLVERRVNAGLAELASYLDLSVVAAVGVGLGLRLLTIGSAPLWLDEVTTALWLREPWRELLRSVLTDNHPPAFYMLLHAWASIAGQSALMVRLPSAVFSTLCVPVIAATANLVAGRRAMRWAAWLAALAPMLVHHGQEARQYAFLALLAAISFGLLLVFVGDRDEGKTNSVRSELERSPARLGMAFVVVTSLLPWTHYYGSAVVLAEVIALAIACPAAWRRWMPAMAVACGATLAAVLVAKMFALAAAGGGYGTGAIAILGVPWVLLTEYTLLPSPQEMHASGVMAVLPYLPMALICAAAAVPLTWWGMMQLSRPQRLAATVVIAIVMTVPYVATFVLQVDPHPRYALAALPPIIVVLAAAAQRPGLLPRALLGSVLLVMAVATMRHLNDPSHGREDVVGAGSWLDAHVAPTEEILVTSEEMAIIARFYWPQRRLRLYPEHEPLALEQVDSVAAGLPFPQGGKEVFYVIGREWVSDPHGVLEQELRGRYADCGGSSVRGVRIICLKARPARLSEGK